MASSISTQVPDDFKRYYKNPVILVEHFEITKIDSFIKKLPITILIMCDTPCRNKTPYSFRTMNVSPSSSQFWGNG